MDRDDTGMSDRETEARQGDTGMIGSESEDPGPGRDTSLTDPDPVAASTDQPRGTVAMSEGDPMRTRLGSHVEGAGAIGYDVAASEEGAATQATPTGDRPGYEPERPAGETTAAWAGPTAAERDAGLATEPVVDQDAYAGDAGVAPGSVVPAAYPGEEEDVTGRPEYAEGGGPQEPGVQEGVFDQEADQARRQRPSDDF
jgi:hypothetical protein